MKFSATWRDADKAIPRLALGEITSFPMRLLMTALAGEQARPLEEWLEDHLRRSLFSLLADSQQQPFAESAQEPGAQADLSFDVGFFGSGHAADAPRDSDFWPMVHARSDLIRSAIKSLKSAIPPPRHDAHRLWTGQLPEYTHMTTSDGKREVVEKLQQMGPYREFFRVRPQHLRGVEALLADAPNLAPATRFLLSQLQVARRSRTGLNNVPRILLVGPPAAGKTWWAERVAAALGLQTCHLSMPTVSASFELSGNTTQWAGAKPGQILRAFMNSTSASPIIILDEIDKVLTHNSNPPGNTLLNLIERSSAIRWRDEFFDREFDVSTAVIIATANNPALIDKPLLSRFHRIDVSVPRRDQLPAMVRSVWRLYRKLRSDLALQTDLDEGVVLRIVAKTNDARSVIRMFDEAIGRAVMRGKRIRIVEADLLQLGPTRVAFDAEMDGPAQ